MKPKTYWVVCRPTENNPMNGLIKESFSDKKVGSIEWANMSLNFIDIWKQLYAKGWRCIKVTLNQMG